MCRSFWGSGLVGLPEVNVGLLARIVFGVSGSDARCLGDGVRKTMKRYSRCGCGLGCEAGGMTVVLKVDCAISGVPT
jgi:hypothetical protein